MKKRIYYNADENELDTALYQNIRNIVLFTLGFFGLAVLGLMAYLFV